MRKISLLFLLLLTTAFAYPPLPEARDGHELLFIRRIIDFWRDKDYPFVKSEIETYLNEYSDTPFHDHFFAMLGDIAMHERSYEEAVKLYGEIGSLEMQESIQIKRWQALYQQQLYSELYKEIDPLTMDLTDEGKFYFAEATFRKALDTERDQASSFCEEALPFYMTLLENDQFRPHAKLAIAEIYRLLDQPNKAAALYLEIAEEAGDDEVLFHAGMMLAQCDTKRATSIFKELTCIGNKRSEESAFQWLQLLVKEERWDELTQERRLFLSRLSKEHLPLGYFYLGMIAFEKEHYHQAILDLSKSGLEDRSALLAMMHSAKEVREIESCEKAYQLTKERFPSDAAEASFIRAQTYQLAGKIRRAITLYDETTQISPESDVSQKATIEKVRLLIQENEWSEAHENVLSFLEAYPDSIRKSEMLRLAIDLTHAQLGEEEVYAQLAEDLERGLSEHVFAGSEEHQKREDLARAYLKLGQVDKAIEILREIPDPDPLLMTQCYVKKGASPERVVTYGEEALYLYPEENRVHLHLFNAYLELAKESTSEALNERAADHLDMVIDIYPISLENRLWLAHHYAKQENVRAVYLLESLLLTETNFKRFDREALLLAELYQKRDCPLQARNLLERVISLKQRTKLKAELLLAKVFCETGAKEEALNLYHKLEDSADLPIAYQARLEVSRMCFEEAPEQSLKKLYGLKVHKTLANEPTHLEAALDHAELKASLLPAKEQTKGLLALLLEVKDDFTNQEDIWSKDYHASRELLPEKDHIYQSYMRYLEAKIFQLQSRLTKDKAEGKTKQQAAQTLFSTLRQGKYAVSKYLIEHSTIGMHE